MAGGVRPNGVFRARPAVDYREKRARKGGISTVHGVVSTFFVLPPPPRPCSSCASPAVRPRGRLLMVEARGGGGSGDGAGGEPGSRPPALVTARPSRPVSGRTRLARRIARARPFGDLVNLFVGQIGQFIQGTRPVADVGPTVLGHGSGHTALFRHARDSLLPQIGMAPSVSAQCVTCPGVRGKFRCHDSRTQIETFAP
jgi:hypothetical protein